ncbi:putative Plastin 2 [Entamoeba marina]
MDSDYIATFPDRYIISNEFLIEPDSRGEYDKIELVRWLNAQLANDEMLTSQYQYIPIKEDGNDFFYALSDGVIIAHIIKNFYPNFNFHIRYAKPGLINKNTNNKEVLRVARIISSKQVTLGEANLSTPERTTVSLILELAQETTGSIEEFMLSWVNTILEEDGVDLKINNFGDDIKDSVAYLHLLHHFNPECSLDALNNNNLLLRAASVLDNADLLNARAFVDAKQIVNGDSVRNYRFVNNLYQIINAPKEESEEIKVEDAYEETKPIDEPEVIEEVPEKVEETKLDKMISIEQTKEELIKKDKEKLAEDIKQKPLKKKKI